MAKPNPYKSEMFAGLPEVIIDPNAYTIEEIRAERLMSDRQARDLIKRKLASGEWELVRKSVGAKSHAYRPASNHKGRKR